MGEGETKWITYRHTSWGDHHHSGRIVEVGQAHTGFAQMQFVAMRTMMKVRQVDAVDGENDLLASQAKSQQRGNAMIW